MSSIQDFLSIFRFTKEEKENATLLLSSDESMAFVAVPTAIGGEGAVCVFTRIGSLWSHSQKLTAEGGESGGHFGKHVALDDDGLLFVGSENKTLANGEAYCFKHNGKLWELCTPLSIIGVKHQQKVSDDKRADALMKFAVQLTDLMLPRELWVRLNNKLVDIAGCGVKATSSVYRGPYAPFDQRNLSESLQTLIYNRVVTADQYADLIRIVQNYIGEERNMRQVPWNPNNPMGMPPTPYPGVYGVPPFSPPGMPQMPQPSPGPFYYPPFAQPIQQPPFVSSFQQQPPTSQAPANERQPVMQFKDRKTQDLNQLNEELNIREHDLELALQRVKYLKAKIKAIEATTEE